MSFPPSRLWWGLCLVLILVSFPARLSRISVSIWSDEAWVANSVLAPTVDGMFHYPTWVQSTPPLFLIVERAISRVLGGSEVALRVFPVIAGTASLVLIAMALRQLFSPAAALIGTTILISNYYAAKYSEQVKSYGADLLVSALLVYLIVLYCTRQFPLRLLCLLTCACVLGCFLSFPAAFLIPAVVLAILAGVICSRSNHLAGIAALCIIFAGEALNYRFFIHPNKTRALVEFWSDQFLTVHNPLGSMSALFRTYSALLVPASFPSAALKLLTEIVLAVAVIGGIRALLVALRGDAAGRIVSLIAPVSIACMIGASFLTLYPVLIYPRLLLWSLPLLALLVAAAVDPALKILRSVPRLATASDAVAVFGCFCAVLLLDFATLHYRQLWEQNADAVAFLRAGMAPDDYLYLHGAMWEQFRYYAQRLAWSPPNIYVGAVDWTCCPLNVAGRASHPGALTFEADLALAAGVARPRPLWLLLPSTVQSRWGNSLAKNCVGVARNPFEETLVLELQCR